MTSVFLYGAFEGNRGDVLMLSAVTAALTKTGFVITHDAADADAIINCCGYWCGDGWGKAWTQKNVERAEEWKAAAKKIIYLPQTWGPFMDPDIAAGVQHIAAMADLLCVRDEQSWDYLSAVVGELPQMQRFPDYTIDVEALPSASFIPTDRSVAIIPSLRMMDKVPPEQSAAYVPFLQMIIKLLRQQNMQPYLLAHEMKDAAFAEHFPDLPVVTEPDAQKTKWIIGHSRAVVSSRYHGILNALYQDVPVLATGWCHKFPALMEGWGMHDSFCTVPCTDDQMQTHIRRMLDRDRWQNEGAKRSKQRDLYRTQTTALWERVSATLRA
jgi:polysaccharide pyruvyl transferase WcaK-like protein